VTPNEIPQPVLAKLFALQHHVEHCAAAAATAEAAREATRTLLSGERTSPRSMMEHKAGQLDLQQLRAEFDALHQAAGAARQRAATEAAILRRCRAWLEQLPSATLDQVAVKPGSDDTLQSVRQRLAAIATELKVLQAAPVPDPQLRQKVEAYVERLAAAAAPELRGIEAGAPFRALWPSDSSASRRNLQGFDEHVANAALMAAWLSPGSLVDRLMAIASSLANQHCPVEERPPRIAALNDEGLRLRYLEEALVVKALIAGDVVVRDPAASPEAVLQVCIRANVKSAKPRSKPTATGADADVATV
jgi:hypothetical protein